MPLASGRRHGLYVMPLSERTALLAALVLIAAAMWWRVGFGLDSLLARWTIIAIVLYAAGCGWFALCRRRPYAAVFVLGFLRGLRGRR
jgi:hypothetical protein